MSKLKKVRVDHIKSDPKYQRDLDQRRVDTMAKGIDSDRIGVPVVSERTNGTLVVVDGQHRVAAMMAAGLGATEITCEVHSGLSITAEAALFLKLNGGRTAVGAFDKYRAELIARAPMALEIDGIVQSAGLRVTRGKGIRCICAIDAVRSVHLRQKNLAEVLRVLKSWAKDNPSIFDADIVKAVAVFLATYPDAKGPRLSKQLGPTAPESVQRRLQHTVSKADGISRSDAACIVLRDIYNTRVPKAERLPPLHVVRDKQEEEAA